MKCGGSDTPSVGVSAIGTGNIVDTDITAATENTDNDTNTDTNTGTDTHGNVTGNLRDADMEVVNVVVSKAKDGTRKDPPEEGGEEEKTLESSLETVAVTAAVAVAADKNQQASTMKMTHDSNANTHTKDNDNEKRKDGEVGDSNSDSNSDNDTASRAAAGDHHEDEDKDDKRFHLRTITNPKDLRKWSKVNYGTSIFSPKGKLDKLKKLFSSFPHPNKNNKKDKDHLHDGNNDKKNHGHDRHDGHDDAKKEQVQEEHGDGHGNGRETLFDEDDDFFKNLSFPQGEDATILETKTGVHDDGRNNKVAQGATNEQKIQSKAVASSSTTLQEPQSLDDFMSDMEKMECSSGPRRGGKTGLGFLRGGGGDDDDGSKQKKGGGLRRNLNFNQNLLKKLSFRRSPPSR